MSRRIFTFIAATAIAAGVALAPGAGELSPHTLTTMPALEDVAPTQTVPAQMGPAQTGPAQTATTLAPLANPDPTVLPGASVEELATSIRPSVVTIWSDLPAEPGYTLRGAGTGILVGNDGLVLTNNHVIAGSTGVRATHVVTGTDYSADVLGYDRTRDIAVLQLRNSAGTGAGGLPPAPLGDAASVAIGQLVVAVGNAGGTGILTTSPGSVTALDQTITAQDDNGRQEKLGGVMQIQAGIRPGDSGGPLLDATGRVIGVNTAASKTMDPDGPDRRGFAVPIGDALTVVDKVREGSSVDTVHVGPTAVLGVQVSTRVDLPSGAQVEEVLPGTAADRIRLRPGDVIIKVDQTHITDVAALTGQIDLRGPGDAMVVHWIDAEGNRFSATAILTEGLPA